MTSVTSEVVTTLDGHTQIFRFSSETNYDSTKSKTANAFLN